MGKITQRARRPFKIIIIIFAHFVSSLFSASPSFNLSSTMLVQVFHITKVISK